MEVDFNLAGDEAVMVGGAFDGQWRVDLPPGADWTAEGGVFFTLDEAVELKRAVDSQMVSETVTVLHFSRLSGDDVIAILGAPKTHADIVMIARALKRKQSEAAQLRDKVVAPDLSAIVEVLGAILEMGDGLPPRAEQDGDVIKLPLYGALDDGTTELCFHKLYGKDLTQIGRAKDLVLATGISVATRRPLAEVRGWLGKMDGADVIAAQRIIGFLSRSGRKTGR